VTLSPEGYAPSLAGANDWLNSAALDISDLRGQVVVVDFWTYTCINWIRTLPYVRAWEKRYRDDGLVIIGVHTPEFSFEHDLANIRMALRQMRITWPVAIDNDYRVWDAFANHYWPAMYFTDVHGRIRQHRFGEGDYARSEEIIQALLLEAGASGFGKDLVSVNAAGPEVEANWDNLESAETYLGYDRSRGFASAGGMSPDRSHRYERPEHLAVGHWSLTGDWTVEIERVISNQPGGRIELAFHARDVHLVMGPVDRGIAVPFRVSIDREPLHDASGSDVDDDGAGLLTEPRMYQLVRQRGPITDRLFTIDFLDRGAEAFAFTFG
jgi:thiol-disulfide isomerase/thioredoxin